MKLDNNKVQSVYEAAQAIENSDVDSKYVEITNVTHEADPQEPNILPQYRVVVDIIDTGKHYETTYCYPVAELGREEGLYLFDTVTLWEQGTVRLRFGLKE